MAIKSYRQKTISELKVNTQKNYDCSTSLLLPVSFNYRFSAQVFNLSLKNVINNFL